ncbi:hypothetical protein [Amycolatopsis nalaikhensis]|uniref:Uncharacterized protein n=1 Tax=Amycolatopsis nalaikhensis TaxID=715472 RepID=A0ABY8XLB7_9PSEU|nr:hypothetical protein [Amycolatopsis sp. 2-2]WIV56419.1 hypothetical protein QP939_47795 [Amycolatopsis sp. 2-2]
MAFVVEQPTGFGIIDDGGPVDGRHRVDLDARNGEAGSTPPAAIAFRSGPGA